MRRLQTAIAMLIAFTVAYVATPRTSEELQAQVGVPCNCNWLAGNTGTVTSTCLGQANMDTLSCAQVGNQCQITGTAVWIPSTPTSCVISGANNGWVRPISNATGSWSYFNPASTAFPQWTSTSLGCEGASFGAAMDVIHQDWVLSGTTCTCVNNTSSQSRVAVKLWTCDSA